MSSAGQASSVGVIGLGIMGSAIARNLAAAGRQVVGFDTDAARCAAARGFGVSVAESASRAAQACEVLLTSLPGATALEATASRRERAA